LLDVSKRCEKWELKIKLLFHICKKQLASRDILCKPSY
jgi:hypothetical protein